MTAVVVAMLGIVVLATCILATVALWYQLAQSPRAQRMIRRYQYVAHYRAYGLRDRLYVTLCASRRILAERLSRPPVPVRTMMRQAFPR